MNKFRNWLFKLLTGYDLIEYKEILETAERINQKSEEILKLIHSTHEDNDRIVELNGRVIEHSKHVLEISQKVIDDYNSILMLCKERNTNETVD